MEALVAFTMASLISSIKPSLAVSDLDQSNSGTEEQKTMSEAPNGAAKHQQSVSLAPPASAIGTLDASWRATANRSVHPKNGLPSEKTVVGQLQPPQDLSSSTLPTLQAESSASEPAIPAWDAAKDRTMKDNRANDDAPFSGSKSPTQSKRGTRRGRGAVSGPNGPAGGSAIVVKIEGSDSHSAPSVRGRGRGPGRPRGSGRGRAAATATRGSKRKREDHDDGDSDSSEIYVPMATTTKSGRSVQKPTSYVPPPQQQSPVSNNIKRRRPYRRNPESAVCKVCLRGTSPASNMIVFCDGCNTPYHRYCHHPPIDQTVVDELDMEWYCRQCQKERFVPVPESEVASFISAAGSSTEERRRYFSGMMPGLLVTLLTKATTLHPDLPLFDPQFGAKYGINNASAPPPANETQNIPRIDTPSAAIEPLQAAPAAPSIPKTGTEPRAPGDYAEQGIHRIVLDNDADDNECDPSIHPPNYPRPGQGLMKTLPPDKDDAQWLVDDEDTSGAFTHIYQADAVAAKAGVDTGRIRRKAP